MGPMEWVTVVAWRLAIPPYLRFRFILSLVRVRGWFWPLSSAAVSLYSIACSRRARRGSFRTVRLELAAVSPYPIVGSRYVLASDAPLSRRPRLIISLVRARCRFWAFRLAAVSHYPFVGAP